MTQLMVRDRIFGSDLSANAVFIMMYLLGRCNKELTCFPSIKTISKDTHRSVSTVKRALRELVEAGYIKKQARFLEQKNGVQTSNLYVISVTNDEPETSTPSDEKITNNRPQSTKKESSEPHSIPVKFDALFSNSLISFHILNEVDNVPVVTISGASP